MSSKKMPHNAGETLWPGLSTWTVSLLWPGAEFARARQIWAIRIKEPRLIGFAQGGQRKRVLPTGEVATEANDQRAFASVQQRARSRETLGYEEREMLRQIPQVGSRLIGKIPRLQEVAKIILYQAKNFDGTGFPEDHVSGADIPLGARILRVLSDLMDMEGRARQLN